MPIPLNDGRFTVPGNRWDLLLDKPTPPVPVAIVVPYYNQQHELDLLLAALDLQDYPAELMHVVVADDGSDRPPHLTATRVHTTLVRQPDQGFRAAAARNLGASRAAGGVLCFLDADTIPQRDYIRRIVALPSVCPDALVVGRRRHADFTGWTTQRIGQWFSGAGAPTEFDEPGWLRDGYDRSGDLLRLDDTSYRYLISSVMCCSATLFDELSGFDESFRQYGGEDWEFAHRAMVNGAVLHHARGAVAWHNGPDWAARAVADRDRAKNAETLAVGRLVPDANARVRGLVYDVPEVAVAVDADGHGPGSLLATIASFLDLDVGLWIHGGGAQGLLDELRLDDPRIRSGAIPGFVLRRCRYTVTVTGRAMLSRTSVAEIVHRCGHPGVGTVTVSTGQVVVACASSWARHRAQRWSTGDVRLRHPGDMTKISSTVEIPPTTTDLREVAPDHPC